VETFYLVAGSVCMLGGVMELYWSLPDTVAGDPAAHAPDNQDEGSPAEIEARIRTEQARGFRLILSGLFFVLFALGAPGVVLGAALAGFIIAVTWTWIRGARAGRRAREREAAPVP